MSYAGEVLKRLGLQTIICSGFQPPQGRRSSLCYFMFQRTVSSSHRPVGPIIYSGPPSRADNFQLWLSLVRKHKNRRWCLHVSVQCELRFAQSLRASERPVCLLVNHASPAARPHVSCCGLTLLSEWTRQDQCSSQLFPHCATKLPPRHVVSSRVNDVEMKHFS